MPRRLTSSFALASLALVAGRPVAAQTVDRPAAERAPRGTAILAAAPRAVRPDRVASLLKRMTLAEKLALIHGAPEAASTYQGQAGWLAGVPRLGVPGLRLADGPPGVLTREISGAPPSTLALAATFSAADATAVGAVVGRNARARGIDVVLEPYINLYRDPTFGRANNTYGEDPLLTGAIGAAFVRGVQAQGVMAQAKHFLAYEGGNDVAVGAQALHELYLAPFADAVASGVSSVMCSYNKVNGPYACGNGALLEGALRGQLGFTGFVTSDWGATHGAEFLARGLDMEMPGETEGPMAAFMGFYFNLKDAPPPASGGPPPGALPAAFMGTGTIPEEVPRGGARPGGFPAMERLQPGQSPTLGAALRRGSVDTAAITRAAGRVLAQIERFGYLDGRQKHSITAEPVAQNAPVLERVAADAAVLLKNDGALPLAASDLARTVLIGPGAAQTFAVVESGEKALGWPARQVGAVAALRARTGRRVGFAVADDMTGVPIPAERLTNLSRTGAGATRADRTIDFTTRNGRALPAGSTAAWSGTLEVPAAGEYDLNLQILGASGSLTIDGKPAGGTGMLALHGDVLQAGQDNVVPTPDGLDNVRRRLTLTRGAHPFTVEVKADPSRDPVQVRLAWVTPEQRAHDRAAAVAAAKGAKTAVVFAWSRGKPEPFGLAGDQDALIEAVAAANPNTVVVLNTGGPVAMPWLSKVRAVLQMWYTGDEGGWAAADLLTGRVSPAGRLPFTWPKRLGDVVANDPAHPERSSAGGADGKTTYSEGILVGYRWFDRQKLEPLFPFGHGLSYGRFDYSGLQVARAADGGVDVSFTLRNAGTRAAAEVPQVYVGPPAGAPDGVQFADRALVAFDRVTLAPGESKPVTLHLTPRRLQYWSASSNEWRSPAGSRPLWVGASSRDVRLTGATAP